MNQAPVAALQEHVSEEPVSGGSDRKRTSSIFADGEDGEESDIPDDGGNVAGILADDETPPGNYPSSPIHTCDGTPRSTSAYSPEATSGAVVPATKRQNTLDFNTVNAFLEERGYFPSDDSIPSDRSSYNSQDANASSEECLLDQDLGGGEPLSNLEQSTEDYQVADTPGALPIGAGDWSQEDCNSPAEAGETLSPFQVKAPPPRPNLTKEETAFLKIHFFLEDLGAPVDAFDRLIKLVRDCIDNHHVDFKTTEMTRKKYLHRLLPSECNIRIPHQETIVRLEPDPEKFTARKKNASDTPNIGPSITVFHFPALPSLVTLLRDPLFEDLSNTVLNPNDPYGKVLPQGGRVSHILSGDWYEDTYARLIKDKTKETLVVFGLYADKTGTDVYQRYPQEPTVVFCPMLKEKILEQTNRCYRHLGFVPDFGQDVNKSKKKDSDRLNGWFRNRDSRNKHICLQVIFADFANVVRLSQERGIEMELNFGGRTEVRIVKMAVAIVCGDGLSQDVFCCRALNYGPSAARITWACTCPYDQADCFDDSCRCQFLKQEDQVELVRKYLPSRREGAVIAHDPEPSQAEAAMTALRAKGTMRCLSSLYFDGTLPANSPLPPTYFFGGNKYGPHRACSVDTMHQLDHCLGPKLSISIFGALGKAGRDKFDVLANRVLTPAKNNSEWQHLPCRVHFTRGITKTTLQTHTEWMGKLCMIMVLLHTVEGANTFFQHASDDVDDKFRAHRIKFLKSLLRRSKKYAILFRKKRGGETLQVEEENQEENPDVDDGDDFQVEDQGEVPSEEDDDIDNPDDLDLQKTKKKQLQNEYNQELTKIQSLTLEELLREAEKDPTKHPRMTSDNLCRLLVDVMCFRQYCRKDHFWHRQGQAVEKARLERRCNELLKLLVCTVPRAGEQWKLQKIHAIFRLLVQQIAWLGSPRNGDCAKLERGLIDWSKVHGRVARKQGTETYTRSVCESIERRRTLGYLALRAGVECPWNSMGDLISNDKDDDDDPSPTQESIELEPKNGPAWTIREITVPAGDDATIPGEDGLTHLFQWHQEGGRKGGTPLFHRDIIEDLYKQNFIANRKYFADELRNGNCVLQGYTDAIINGTRYRCHPNYKGNGVWNQWAIIEEPNSDEESGNAKDMSGECIKGDQMMDAWKKRAGAKAKGDNKYHYRPCPPEYPHTQIGWIDWKYHPNKSHWFDKARPKSSSNQPRNNWNEKAHVPAKILAIYKDPQGQKMALVHPCRPKSLFNHEYSNPIIDSWTKQFYWYPENGVMMQFPSYNEVELSSIKQRILVFEEVPGVHECLPDGPSSNHVLVLRPPEEWADRFLEHP